MRNSDVSSMPNDTVVILCEVNKSLDDTYVINMTSAAFGTLDVDGDIFNCMDNSSSYDSLENNLDNLEEGKTYYCFPKTINELRELYQDVNNVNFLVYKYYKDLNECYNIITKINDEYSIHSIPFSEISKKSDNPIKEIEESGEIKSNYKGKNIEIAKPSIVTPNYNCVYNGINLLEFEKYLKDRVIGNDKVIERIASTILLNLTYNNPKLVENMLNIGPTGTGKTYTFELISEYLGVPLLIFNASSLSTAGYQGFDTNDLLKQVYIKADGDIEKANKAIVILDEIDKLKNSKLDIKEQAQNDLLALLGGSNIIVELDSQRGTTCTLNTKSMTFVGCGAFTELFDPAIEHEKAEDKMDPYTKMVYLKEKERQEEEQKLKEEIKEKELKRIPIGFHTEEEYNLIRMENEKKLKEHEEEKQKKKLEQEAKKNNIEITDDDLVKYGIKRELVGRLPVRNVFANLDKKGLTSVLLDAKDSILNLKKESYLEQFNTELECSQSFIDGVVDLSLKENLGGRSLNKVCSQVFKEIDRQMLIEDHTEHKVLRLTKKNIDDPNSFKFRVKKM